VFFLLPEKYLCFERSKKDTSDFPRKAEIAYISFDKKISQIFQENLWYIFFEKKIP